MTAVEWLISGLLRTADLTPIHRWEAVGDRQVPSPVPVPQRRAVEQPQFPPPAQPNPLDRAPEGPALPDPGVKVLDCGACSQSQRSAVARAQEGPAVVEFGFCAPTGPALRPLEGSVQDPTARCQAAGEPQPMSATAMHSQRQEHRFVGTHFFLASSFRDPSM